MENGPQVRQDLLPAARDFLLVTAGLQGRIHPAVPTRPFPSPANDQYQHQPYQHMLYFVH
jgi:hypothetical protein